MEFQCYDLRMGQRGCRVVVPLLPGVGRCVGLHRFASFVSGCAFDSACAHFAYCCSREVDLSPVDSVLRWFPYGFADGRPNDLVKEVLPSGREMRVGCLERVD